MKKELNGYEYDKDYSHEIEEEGDKFNVTFEVFETPEGQPGMFISKIAGIVADNFTDMFQLKIWNTIWKIVNEQSYPTTD